MSAISDAFGPGGYLAQATPGYEMRPQQVRLSSAVDDAIVSGRPLLAEGPCGTGKAFAYLVPAIYRATQERRKVLVVTANIALQEQLVQKDLPALQKVLPWPFTFALLKGRRNYLCLDALLKEEATIEMRGVLSPLQEQQRSDIVAWSKLTQTGDRSELSFEPGEIWERFSIEEDCKGKNCSHYRECWATKARTAVQTADVVVTNYHMLFACMNLVLAGVPLKALPLPPYDVLICDEAHEMADIARDFLGWRCSFGSFKRLATVLAKEWGINTEQLRFQAERFFDAVSRHGRDKNAYNIRLRRVGEVDPEDLRAEMQLVYDALCDRAPGSKEREAEQGRLRRRMAALQAALEEAADPATHREYVIFIEEGKRGGRSALVSKLVDPAPVLREMLWKRLKEPRQQPNEVEFEGTPAPRPPPSVILTSATLSTDGANDFDFIRAEVGVPPGATQLSVESPFDFTAQSMLLIPNEDLEIPDPKDPQFAEAVAEVIAEIATVLGGSTLGLFTSYKNLNTATQIVAQRTSFRVFKQGEAPVGKLVADFKQTPGSVLLGTASLWTGVDIKGDALRAVVIDKIPFPSPSDPIMNALEERDPRGVFGKVSLPRAIIALRQGFGRLIRGKDDRGVVAILDPRLSYKGYKHKILSSLPDTTPGTQVSHVAWFLGVEPSKVAANEEVPF